MVQNNEWGPPLWMILHICVENCGRQPSAILHTDEVRAWIQLLHLVEAILPCPLCQKHYRDWLRMHPPKRFLDKRNPTGFYEAAQKWLWDLHDKINEQRGVERMSLEEAKELYSTKTTADLQRALERLLEVLERAKLQRLIDGIHAREWRQKLALLRGFLKI